MTQPGAPGAGPRSVHDLSLVLTGEEREVHFDTREPGRTLGHRVRAKAIGYRTFIADGLIYTDVLVETLGSSRTQMFLPLPDVVFHQPTGPTERVAADPGRDGSGRDGQDGHVRVGTAESPF